VLLRHGESEWNKANLFTGWVDVPLSEKGRAEAARGGRLLAEQDLLPDVLHTSLLRRAIRTADIALDAMRTFEQDVRAAPEGSVRDQLVWLVDGMRRKWNDPKYRAIMRRVTGDGVANPEAYRQARGKLISPHLEALHAVLRRGVNEGLIRPDLDLAWIRQMMTAPIMTATLTFKERVSKAQIEATVDVVLRGAAP